jgi:alanine racemase
VRRRIGASSTIAFPVKSNGYGHGLEQVVTAVDDLVDRYLVDDSRELVQLRALTTHPIELLGYVGPDELSTVHSANGVIPIFDEDHANLCKAWAQNRGCSLEVMVAVDLCFGREGVPVDQAPALIRSLASSQWLSLRGIYGHLSSADDDPYLTTSREQFRLLKSITDVAQCSHLETHLFASSGIFAFDHLEPFSQVVRPGLSIYGIWPSEQLRHNGEALGYSLLPALAWHSRVVQIKRIPAGFPIGYGGSFRSTAPMTIGLIPQGYGDGLPRAYAEGAVLVNGERCPILGRISMNMITIDLTPLRRCGNLLSTELPAVILGSQGAETISAEEHAVRTSTIPYEVTTRISPLLPRVLTD